MAAHVEVVAVHEHLFGVRSASVEERGLWKGRTYKCSDEVTSEGRLVSRTKVNERGERLGRRERANGKIYVFRAADYGEYRAGEQFLHMMRAKSLAEWKDAMRMRAIVEMRRAERSGIRRERGGAKNGGGWCGGAE